MTSSVNARNTHTRYPLGARTMDSFSLSCCIKTDKVEVYILRPFLSSPWRRSVRDYCEIIEPCRATTLRIPEESPEEQACKIAAETWVFRPILLATIPSHIGKNT